jgi:hypothetical protein
MIKEQGGIALQQVPHDPRPEAIRCAIRPYASISPLNIGRIYNLGLPNYFDPDFTRHYIVCELFGACPYLNRLWTGGVNFLNLIAKPRSE